MIKIVTKSTEEGSYFDFIMVKNDTGQFKATPIVNGEPYEIQPGDEISFRLSRTADSAPILEVIGSADYTIIITAEQSAELSVGDYYCDITLNYANGNKDTYIKIPTVKKKAISNFHVTYGV